MEAHLPDWLWPIGLLTFLGACVDFLIGRAGQQSVKDFLETWWIKFDDVHWRNFGRKEAYLAVAAMDVLFGAR
jgi:hypothetical protein